jgi:hypothetical protein
VTSVTPVRLVTCAALALAVAAAGCGGDDKGDGGGSSSGGEAAAVEKALKDYAAALVGGDEAKACDLLTPTAQKDAAAEVPGAGSCVKAHATVIEALGVAKRRQFARALAGVDLKADVSGDTAEISSPGSPGGKTLKMRRVGGQWKLDQNTLFYNPS